MKIVDIEEFVRLTLGGRPVRANLSVYVSQSFECGCGNSHRVHDEGVDVLRELRKMRFVFQCHNDYATCVHIKGLFKARLVSEFSCKVDED